MDMRKRYIGKSFFLDNGIAKRYFHIEGVSGIDPKKVTGHIINIEPGKISFISGSVSLDEIIGYAREIPEEKWYEEYKNELTHLAEAMPMPYRKE